MKRTACLLGVLALLAGPLGAQHKSEIVPESFLRGYDPVTVMYDAAVGPSGGGPADGPGEFLRISPSVPGEYRWLDERTIQFLPAAPWPALKQFTVAARSRNLKLETLMAAPAEVNPAPGSTGLAPVSTITLNFPAALEIGSLGRMVRIEVRELPGLSTAGSWWLSSADFTIRPLERQLSPTSAGYQILLKQPIPYGRRAILHLRLSLDESLPDAVARYSFETRPEFRLLAMGSGATRFPVTPAGAAYAPDQALNFGTQLTPLVLQFSEDLQPVPLETLKRLVSLEPSVRNLRHQVSGGQLSLRFEADPETQYRLTVNYQPLSSLSGRTLAAFAPASFYFFYRQASPYLTWKAAQGIAERFGPQRLPMEGRGVGRVDLRVYRIDAENLNFWPFPAQPLPIDEDTRPPMPGEEPPYGSDLPQQVRLLGSPEISRILDLPVGESSPRSAFGLDLRETLAGRLGPERPGTYLIGYRVLGAGSRRSYLRLTVTDLCLSTVEEEDAVLFLVTSLASGAPVTGAGIRVEARTAKGLETLFSGETDQLGRFRYAHQRALPYAPMRIVVSKGEDLLVLDARNPPPVFASNHWSQSGAAWLDWLASAPQVRRHDARVKAHILTERPVYRPEEEVHILGWVRDRRDGRIVRHDEKMQIRVFGPGGRSWNFPAEQSGNGRCYVLFREADTPTGEYTAELFSPKLNAALAQVRFRKESYRVPLFETAISGPDRVPLDRPFELELTADYYAGGRVVGETVEWEVTRYPYSIANPTYPGYLFSTDERFSGSARAGAAGVLRRSEVLDDEGSARIQINPAADRDAGSRRYVAAATVRGADRQSVTTVKQVLALPPFSIGLRLERLLTGSLEIKPQIVVLDHAEKPLAGKQLAVRLYQRQWHSYIAETDFTTGEAKYVTDVVDLPLAERALSSGDAPLSASFPVKEAGVYVVEVSARDHLGRLLQVKSDLFAAGPTPVAWDRKRAELFEALPDRTSYDPGMTAQLLLKSPFQQGYALVVVEAPEANEYGWVRIQNGQGLYSIKIRENMVPGVPVNVLLERGRAGPADPAGRGLDLGRPAAVGASAWLRVEPAAHRLEMRLEHAERREPGSTLKIRLRVNDWQGRPVDGEAALWLVDKAVLSLGKELPQDPLPSFIDSPASWVRLRDTRNLAFGNLPTEEIPGGDGLAEEMLMAGELFQRVTVRRNFRTVPYFQPGIPVRGGQAEVEVNLPDNLTDFAIRAVATSGYDRFGAARSSVSVRLPVIVQSMLPRFVRPGDSFEAGGIARVVEGAGGPARAAIKVEGLQLVGPNPNEAARDLNLEARKAARLLFPMRAPDLLTEKQETAVSLAVERKADRARDAFRIPLPVRADVEVRRLAVTRTAEGDGEIVLPEPEEEVREGTIARTVIAARDPRLLAILQGLDYLQAYTHGCLEQRISKLYPAVLLRELLEAAGLPEHYRMREGALTELQAFMASCQDAEGLFGFWPGSPGTVNLTAYALEFLGSCREAKLPVDSAMMERAAAALERALRSDYRRLLSGYGSYERVEALAALEANGRFDEAYANDLLEGSAALPLYSQARLYLVLARRDLQSGRKADQLAVRLQDSVLTKREGSRELFAGLQLERTSWGGLVLSSEVKTVGALIDALQRQDPRSARLALLVDHLAARADSSGWGSTQDNVAAMRALKTVLTVSSARLPDATLEVITSAGRRRLSTEGKGLTVFRIEGPATLKVRRGASRREPLFLLLLTEYQPRLRGSQIAAQSAGFAVERELVLIDKEGAATTRQKAKLGVPLAVPLEAVAEEHVTVVNFQDRNFAAISVPLAAGFEPLNPQLAGAPREAWPSSPPTWQPTYTLYADDRVVFYYDTLPKGNYHFFFRVRASFRGTFSQPPARAELLYNLLTFGRTDGAEVRIAEARAEAQ